MSLGGRPIRVKASLCEGTSCDVSTSLYHLYTPKGALNCISLNAEILFGIRQRINPVSGLLFELPNSINSLGLTEARVLLRNQMTKKILVVEDEPDSLKILRYFLTHEGYESVGAKDGVEAIELLAQSQFDLVLSDVRMPRLDGVAVAKHLLSALPITPVILMTGYDSASMDTILNFGVPMPKQAPFIGPVAVAN
jgi:CheY-like chemotaxis protein